jgi:hypothetical protein
MVSHISLVVFSISSKLCGSFVLKRTKGLLIMVDPRIKQRVDYEDWPGYCEHLMTRDEMLSALDECNEKWHGYEFRGHKVLPPKIHT